MRTPATSTRAPAATVTLLTLLGTACAGALRSAPGDSAHVERLYFGRNIGDTAVVSDAAWARFLREVVTPRFPEGLTVWDARGQWRGPGGTVMREGTFVLELVHVLDRDGESRVEAVIAEYKRRFAQQAVLRVVTAARASF